MSEGRDDRYIVNAGQLNNFRRYVNEKLNKIINVFNVRMKITTEQLHNFYTDEPLPDDKRSLALLI